MESLLEGSRLGRYRVIAQIGRGGMASVFRAHDPEHDRHVAIKVVMLNTNGIRIAGDDRFLSGLADVGATIYLQFDGFSTQTHQALRGKDLLKTKLKALDRLAEAGMDVVLVSAIEKGVNHGEIGAIVKFGIEHPSVTGIAL